MIQKYVLRTFAFSTLLVSAALWTPVAVAQGYGTPDRMDPFSKHVSRGVNKEGMMTKKDFMTMMEKRWQMMDKDNKGVLRKDVVMQIVSEKPYAGH